MLNGMFPRARNHTIHIARAQEAWPEKASEGTWLGSPTKGNETRSLQGLHREQHFNSRISVRGSEHLT